MQGTNKKNKNNLVAPAAVHLKQIRFSSETHCVGSGTLPVTVLSEHSMLLYPQLQVETVMYKNKTKHFSQNITFLLG